MQPEDETVTAEQEAAPAEIAALPGGGEWLFIAFMGRIEYTGYVTEITRHGQPAYRIELPEKVWGGNPLAYVTHSASAWFSDHPVTEESVRKAWESRARAAARAAAEETEWRRALTAGQVRDDEDQAGDDAGAGPDYDWAERTGNYPVSSPADPF
jgi:hypothetical protein